MKGNVINISIVINKRKKVAKKENYQNQKSKYISGFDRRKKIKLPVSLWEKGLGEEVLFSRG
jgi:hypothetical protein